MLTMTRGTYARLCAILGKADGDAEQLVRCADDYGFTADDELIVACRAQRGEIAVFLEKYGDVPSLGTVRGEFPGMTEGIS